MCQKWPAKEELVCIRISDNVRALLGGLRAR